MTKKIVIIFLGYLLLTVILLWPLAPRAADSVINAGDPLFYAWNLEHNWKSVFSGLRDLLDTNIYYPTTNTLAFSDTLFAQTGLLSPILGLTGNPILAENIYILLTFPLAGLGMYLLAHWLTRDDKSSLVAGLFYAFSYARLGQISHISIISSQWFPFLFLALFQFLQEGRLKHALAYTVFYLLLVASTIYFAVFATIASLVVIGVYTLSFIHRHHYAPLTNRWKKIIILSLPTLLAVFALNFPYVRLKIEHPEFKRTLEESSARGAYQENFFSVLPTSIIAGKTFPPQEGERSLYPTVTLLFLALCAFIRKKKLQAIYVVLFGFLAAISLILTLGPERPFYIGPFTTGYIRLPYAFAYKLFPLMQTIRVPSRFMILAVLALSALASLSMAKIHILKKRPWIFLLIAGFFLAEIWQYPLRLVPVPSYQNLPEVYAWIKKQKPGPLVELPIQRIEMGKTPIQEQIKKQYKDINENDPLVAETYRTYFAGFHEQPIVNGYSGFIPQSFQNAADALASFPSDEAMRFLTRHDINTVIVHTGQYDKTRLATLIESIKQQSKLIQVASFGEDIVYATRK